MLLIEKLCKLMWHMPQLIFILSILGFVATLYLMITGRMSSTSTINFLFIVSALTSGAYILFDRFWNLKQGKNQNLSDNLASYRRSPRFCRILDLAFWIGYSILLLIIFFSDARPFSYILLLALLAVIAVAPALLSWDNNSYSSLGKIILLFFVSSLSLFKVYFWIGRDSWRHAIWNFQLVQEGYLYSGLGKEFATPLQHVAVSLSEIVTGLSVRDATILYVTIPLLLLFALSVFIVSRNIVGAKFAVVAVIISSFVVNVSYWAACGVTTTFAYALFAVLLIILYQLLFNKGDEKNNTYVGLFLLLVLAIALAHLFSSFMVFLFLIGVAVTYVFVRIFWNKKESFTSLTAVLVGLGILAVYTLLTQFSLMSSIFNVAFEELFTVIFQYLPIEGFVAGFLGYLPAENTLSASPQLLSEISAMISECFVAVLPSLSTNLTYMGIEYSLILIPFIVAVCFASKLISHGEFSEFVRKYLYVLIPSMMIFILFGITAVAYPPMSGRPACFILIFIGILIGSLLWYYVGNVSTTQLSKKAIQTILVIILLLVCVGSVTYSIHTDNAFGLKEELVDGGHSILEIEGLSTITTYLPANSKTFVDYEMEDTIKYAANLNSVSYLPQLSNIYQYNPNMNLENNYLKFKLPLLREATYVLTKAGGSEITWIWDKYNIDSVYPELMGSINSVIYENGELVLFEV